jgi:hypothetical protein
MPQIGNGVPAFQDFVDIRLDGLKSGTFFFLLFERIGGEAPRQKPKETCRIFLGKPRVDEAGVFMVSFCPGEGLEVFRLGMRGLPKKRKGYGSCQEEESFPESVHAGILFFSFLSDP